MKYFLDEDDFFFVRKTQVLSEAMARIRKSIGFYLSVLFWLSMLFLSGCRKDEVPVLTTSKITDLTATAAITGGTITDEGSSRIITRGVCWSENADPTIINNKTNDSTDTGSFVSIISSLTPGTRYFVRAYATNSYGTGYGKNISFTTEMRFDLFPLKVGNEYYYEYSYSYDKYLFGNSSKGFEKWTILTDSIKMNNIEYYIEKKFNGIDISWSTTSPVHRDTSVIKDRIKYFKVIENPSGELSFWGVTFIRYQENHSLHLQIWPSQDYITTYDFSAGYGLTRYGRSFGLMVDKTREDYIQDSVNYPSGLK